MRYLLFSIAFVFWCCQNEKPDNQLLVTVEKIPLRVAPGAKSAAIASLRKGNKLLDLGEVSHFESVISFNDEAIRAPWLKVQTADKKQGWVFAGAVQPSREKADWMLQKRLDCYFGHAFASRLNALRRRYDAISSAENCALAYRSTIAMRDSMLYLLERRAEPDGRPDYYWLADVLPGFIQQQAYEGGPPNLFVNYDFWRQIALKTPGATDDNFFETCCFVFPQDSIESFFPRWKFQLSELESASQLGTGAHLSVLQQIDNNLAASRLFERELMRIKDAVLEDIQDKNTRYWQAKELILRELDTLIAKPPACLSDAENSALTPRRVMLAAAEEHGILVDMRSGSLPPAPSEGGGVGSGFGH